MSNGSRLSRKAELSLVCLQIHPLALMMQKHAWLCLSTSRLKSMKKKWNKEDLKKDGCSNVYVFRWRQYFTIERWGGGVVGSFHWVGIRVCGSARAPVFQCYFLFKGEWAFNMQLRICLSVNHSLMSCRLWEGSGIIKHFQWVPRREMTGCVKFFIISKNKKPASPLTGNFNQL